MGRAPRMRHPLTRCRPRAALCAARTKDFITPVWTFAGEHFVAA